VRHLPKPALGALAGLVLVFASGCSSPAATPADASTVISQVINGGSAVKSFHLKLTVSGTIKTAALGSAGAAAGGLTGDIKLDGAAIEGDVDVANQAAHLTLGLPAMAVSGDVIVAGGSAYYKISYLGMSTSKYTKQDLGSLTSMSPVAIPTPGASALAGLTDQVNQVRAALTAAGVKATNVGVGQIGGKDADHISISVPIDTLNQGIASEAGGSAAPKIDSASVDLWVYTDGNRVAQVEVKAASSTLGNIDLVLTISDYDKAVTVTAPSADQIAAP
jgi:hypothetical protein